MAPVVAVLAEMGWSPPRDEGWSRIVPGAIADAILEDASIRLRDPAIGLSIAERLPLGGLGDLDYALITSPTLKDGLDRLARFYGVVSERVTLTLDVGPETTTLAFAHRPGVTPGRHWMELSFAAIATRIRQTVGTDVAFAEIAFVHAAPRARARARHDAFFGLRVRFGADADRLSLPSALVGRPLRTASAALAEVIEARMREIQPRDDDAFVARVRGAIASQLDEGQSDLARLARAAAQLHTSTRVLQRELAARGAPFRVLLDDVRCERARRLLARGDTVAEVSDALGFSEPSAFFRAYRRWTGTSPKASVMRADEPRQGGDG